MSYEKFKKFTPVKGTTYADQSGDDTPKNPYTAKREPKKSPPINNDLGEGKQDEVQMAGKMLAMEREIKALKQDIATLVTILEEDYQRKMSSVEARDIYFKFRANPSHLENRLTDKKKEIPKNDEE